MDLVGRPWALGQGTLFHEKKSERAKELILAVGGDPEMITHEEMDNQGHRFVRRLDVSVSFESFYSMVWSICYFWIRGSFPADHENYRSEYVMDPTKRPMGGR